MTRKFAITALCSAAVFGLSACSQETGSNAERAAELAADDIEANAQVVGEELEDGAAAAAGAVSRGAGTLEENIRAGDEEEPGPAPITGDDLNSDEAAN